MSGPMGAVFRYGLWMLPGAALGLALYGCLFPW